MNVGTEMVCACRISKYSKQFEGQMQSRAQLKTDTVRGHLSCSLGFVRCVRVRVFIMCSCAQAFAERASTFWAPRQRGGRKESDAGPRQVSTTLSSSSTSWSASLTNDSNHEAALALGSSYLGNSAFASTASTSSMHGPLGLENELRELAMASPNHSASGNPKRPLVSSSPTTSAAAAAAVASTLSDDEEEEFSGWSVQGSSSASDQRSATLHQLPPEPLAHSFGAYDVDGESLPASMDNNPSSSSSISPAPKKAPRMKKVRLLPAVSGSSSSATEITTAAAAAVNDAESILSTRKEEESGASALQSLPSTSPQVTRAEIEKEHEKELERAKEEEAARVAQEVPGRIVHLYKRLGATIAAAHCQVHKNTRCDDDNEGAASSTSEWAYPPFLRRIDPQVEANKLDERAGSQSMFLFEALLVSIVRTFLSHECIYFCGLIVCVPLL